MGRSIVSPLRVTRATGNRASDITNRDLERVRDVARALVRTKGKTEGLTDPERTALRNITKRGGAASSLMKRAINGNQSVRRGVAERASGELTLRKRDPNYRGQPGAAGQMPRQGLGPLAPRG